MECAACGTDDELVYRCERCLGIFCATHHDHRYHDCSSGGSGQGATDRDASGESGFLWGEHLTPTTPSEWIWGSADDAEPAEGAAREASADEGDETGEDPLDRAPAAEPAAGPASAAGGSMSGTGADAEVPETTANAAVSNTSPDTAATATQASSVSPSHSVSGRRQERPEIPQEASRPGYGPEPFSAEPVGPPTTFTEWLRRQTYLSLTVKVGIVASLFNLLAYSLIAVAMVLSLG